AASTRFECGFSPTASARRVALGSCKRSSHRSGDGDGTRERHRRLRRGFAARARPGGRRVIGRGTKPPGGPGAWLTAGCANACCCAGGCGGGGGGRVSWRILVAWLGAGLSHAGSPGTSAAPAAWSKGRVAPVALPAF